MPKVNLGRKTVNPLAEKVLGRMAVLGLSYRDVEGPGLSAATLSRRLQQPVKFSIEELGYLSRKLDIPADEMRALIKF